MAAPTIERIDWNVDHCCFRDRQRHSPDGGTDVSATTTERFDSSRQRYVARD